MFLTATWNRVVTDLEFVLKAATEDAVRLRSQAEELVRKCNAAVEEKRLHALEKSQAYGDMLSIEGKNYCRLHRFEACGECCADYRIQNRLSDMRASNDVRPFDEQFTAAEAAVEEETRRGEFTGKHATLDGTVTVALPSKLQQVKDSKKKRAKSKKKKRQKQKQKQRQKLKQRQEEKAVSPYPEPEPCNHLDGPTPHGLTAQFSVGTRVVLTGLKRTPDLNGKHLELIDRGNADYKLGHVQRAENLYTMAIVLDPNSHACYSNRSRCRARLGRFQSALDDARVCTKIKPGYQRGWLRQSTALLSLCDPTQARYAAWKGIALGTADQATAGKLQDALQRASTLADSVCDARRNIVGSAERACAARAGREWDAAHLHASAALESGNSADKCALYTIRAQAWFNTARSAQDYDRVLSQYNLAVREGFRGRKRGKLAGRRSVASALRGRASIFIHNNWFDAAEVDLKAAIRMWPDVEDGKELLRDMPRFQLPGEHDDHLTIHFPSAGEYGKATHQSWRDREHAWVKT